MHQHCDSTGKIWNCDSFPKKGELFQVHFRRHWWVCWSLLSVPPPSTLLTFCDQRDRKHHFFFQRIKIDPVNTYTLKCLLVASDSLRAVSWKWKNPQVGDENGQCSLDSTRGHGWFDLPQTTSDLLASSTSQLPETPDGGGGIPALKAQPTFCWTNL